MAQLDISLWGIRRIVGLRLFGIFFILFFINMIGEVVSLKKIFNRYLNMGSLFAVNLIPLIKIDETKNVQAHPYHVVRPSRWPIVFSLSLSTMLLFAVLYRHDIWNWEEYRTWNRRYVGIACIVTSVIAWAYEVHIERSVEGAHTKIVKQNLLFGFRLFILSEVRLFRAFFWAFGHLAVNPSIIIGEIWPPFGIQPLDPYGLPLVNTILLLSSGVLVTWVHSVFVCAGQFYEYGSKLQWLAYKNGKKLAYESRYDHGIHKIDFVKMYEELYPECVVEIMEQLYSSYKFLREEEGIEEEYGIETWSKRWRIEFIDVAQHSHVFEAAENEVIGYFNEILNSYNDSTLLIRIRFAGKDYILTTLIQKFWKFVVCGLSGAIILGVMFTACQVYEYIRATFDISDGVYGSTFFILTGLHGLHVCLGTIILFFQLVRFLMGAVFARSYNGLLARIWYWHFVDIVWLAVYFSVYVWGAGGYIREYHF